MCLCTDAPQGIEKSLSEHISYLTQVSTTLAHEGSAYGMEKVNLGSTGLIVPTSAVHLTLYTL